MSLAKAWKAAAKKYRRARKQEKQLAVFSEELNEAERQHLLSFCDQTIQSQQDHRRDMVNWMAHKIREMGSD